MQQIEQAIGESKVGDNWWEDLSNSGNQHSGNPCDTSPESLCCSTCGGHMDWWCHGQSLNCPSAAVATAAEKGLTAQNRALKQANSKLMQQIEQAIGESKVG